MTLHAGLHGGLSVAQLVARDEILRQLIERAVEIGVEPGLPLARADQDFPDARGVEGKAGALADEDMARGFARKEAVSGRLGLIKQEMKDLQPLVEDQQEPDAGFVEDRTQELLVLSQKFRGRLDPRQIVQRKRHALAGKRDA